MCWVCDHPGSTMNDYFGYLRAVIARTGWAVQGIERERLRPPWAYTLGLTAHGKPELVATGLPLIRATRLLNDVAAHLLDTGTPAPGSQMRLADGTPIEFVAVAVPAAHLDIAVGLYGDDVRALQVVHADGRGHWPWDRRYRGLRGGQPVLGARARDFSRRG